MIRAGLACGLTTILLAAALGQQAGGDGAANVDGLTAQFRDIVCAEAANFDSPIHEQAIGLVRSNGYRDERFADAIRSALTGDDQVEPKESYRRIKAALSLVRSTEIEPPELVSRLLTLLQRETDSFHEYASASSLPDLRRFRSQRVPVPEITSLLDDHKQELAAQLLPMLAENPTALQCALASLTEEFGVDLVPPLLLQAQSDDRGVKLTSLSAANRILSRLQRRQRESNRVANDNDVERYLKVSERLFSRYDKNGDKALTESEWSTMLIDPSAADTNRDESISVEEYAKFMMSRQRTRPSFSDAIRPQQRE